MSSHLDEFYTANLIFDNCSISSTISHQMRNYICLAVYVYKKNYLANLSQCLTISTLATNLPYNISILHMLTYIFCGFYIYLVNFFNIWGGSVEFMIMYHESFMEGFGKWYSMLIYFYIDYNLVTSNTFIFDTTFLIVNCR